jgi:pimeloyl-ACP methyl ester carboxylesterase
MALSPGLGPGARRILREFAGPWNGYEARGAATGREGMRMALLRRSGRWSWRRGTPDPQAATAYGSLKADRTREVASFDGSILVVDEFGPAEAGSGVIFLHGICLDSRIWHHQFPEAGHPDPWRRVFYDARGHGRSLSVGDAPPDLSTLAADLRAVIAATGLCEVVLVGHSMGGMTVLRFCADYPEAVAATVRGLVLVNTTYAEALRTFALVGAGKIEARARRLLDWVLAEPRRHRHLRLTQSRLSRFVVRSLGFGRGASPTQIAFVTRMLEAFPTPAMTGLLSSLFSFSLESGLGRIPVPTLIIAGGQDRMTGVVASRRMAERIPGSELVVFEGSGHLTIIEEPERFNKVLQRFVCRVLVDGPAVAAVREPEA